MQTIGDRLEQYTLKRPQEVLFVTAEIDGEFDQVLIFKGFSSSLVRSTAYDPDIPVLPATAQIVAIDRFEAPYNPAAPRLIQQEVSPEEMQALLAEVGV